MNNKQLPDKPRELQVVAEMLQPVAQMATGGQPNLQVFAKVKGDLVWLTAGLVAGWVGGRFVEELLYRGLLLNAFHAGVYEPVHRVGLTVFLYAFGKFSHVQSNQI